MADVSKLKKASRLGAPPAATEASENLAAPEVAPAAPTPKLAPSVAAATPRMDARSARRTNRTQQFATRVTPEWDARIRSIAAQEGLMLTEVLERALDAYEQQKASS